MSVTSLPASIALTLALVFFIPPTASHPVGDGVCSTENSYLWRVHTQPPVYLFGTMHVPYTKLWNFIPENAKTAFGSSEDLCLELRLSDRDTVEQLIKCQELPGELTVDDVISEQTVDRIKSYFETIRSLIPKWLGNKGSALFGGSVSSDALFNAMVSGWMKKRPIWILLILSSLTEENIRSRNIPLLDRFLENAAEGLGKQVQALETPREQCRPLNKLSNEQVELALRVKLDQLEHLVEKHQNIEGNFEEDIQTYRCGDFAGLISTTPLLPLPPLENINETSKQLTSNETDLLHEMEAYLWKHMVVRRNRRMANNIKKLLTRERNQTYFFALGAGHYLSENSVVDRLRRKGYTVEHIPVHTSIDGPSLPHNIIQLGDPSRRVMNIPTAPQEQVHNLPTLSPETLGDIWQRHLIRPSLPPWTTFATPTTQTTPTPTQGNSVKDPHQTTEQNEIQLSVRNSPLHTEGTDDVQSSTTPPVPTDAGKSPNTPPPDMWENEVMELFLDFDLHNSGTTIYGHMYSRTTLLILSLTVVIWKVCLNLLAH